MYISKRIAKNNLKGISAIAPKIAADIFGLAVLADDIQTIKKNGTRFFILKRSLDSPDHESKYEGIKNKASLKFITKHKTGSLAEVLDIFAKHEISLTKIQSMPIIDKQWTYAFFIDLLIDDYKLYENAVHLIRKKVVDLKIFGEYQQNRKNDEIS